MRVNLHEPSFGEDEIEAAVTQMRTTQVTMGKQVRKFEEQCGNYFGNSTALMCNSGSSANLLAVAALCNPAWLDHMKSGDEVIVPALSWATTVWPIIQHNLVPVFVDCDLATYNFDYEKLIAAITPKTRAIMVVHVYGNPCNMDLIMSIARKHNLYVIEDTCESMGAKWCGRYVGTFGDVGTMSLYYSHHITTFEGGLCFGNPDIIDLMRVLRAHGWSRESDNHEMYAKKYPEIDPRFIFINLGYNLRPTEVQAVMGMKQLPKLHDFVLTRRKGYNNYLLGLEPYQKYFRFQLAENSREASWFGFGIVLTEECPFSLKEITSFLQKNGVETRPIIAGNMARHPALKMYKHRISGTLENCDIIMNRGFAIGCHHAITKENQDYVISVFSKFMQKYSLLPVSLSDKDPGQRTEHQKEKSFRY
jgi:CDP-6-deoxy-D-xylo-4-hexulose-3-dehydrase